MLAAFEYANQILQQLLFGGSMVVLLIGIGVYFTVKTHFFQLRGIPFIFQNTAGTLLKKSKSGDGKNLSSFQAVTTALAGTMGVGNIAGVATALVAGGPGSIFWMWCSAFFGMLTKYAEIYLSVLYRRTDSKGRYYGGPMYYIEDGLGSRWLACIFALLCTVSSLGIGNMTQINSVSTAMNSAFAIPYWVSGAFVAVVVALVVFGGIQRIGRVTEMVIPFISILYLAISIAFLCINRLEIPQAFSLIFQNALGLRSVTGGAVGYAVSHAVRMGLSRGVFTNEAGLGSAPIAHAAANCKSPAHQGVWGIFEVFLDTIVVCTITALVILTAQSGTLWQSGLDGAPLTSAAFSSVFGRFGGQFIAVSILFFAVAAMLGWCYYGESALGYLFQKKKGVIFLYRLIFTACVLLGAVGELTLVWSISDSLNAMMAIPNVLALWLLRKKLRTP